MITKKKIEIFNRYNGDIDKWARNNCNKEKLIENCENEETITQLKKLIK